MGMCGQVGAPPGDSVFVGSHPVVEQAVRTVRELASRGRWEEAFRYARKTFDSIELPERRALLLDPDEEGIVLGVKEALFGFFRAPPKGVREAIQNRADADARADWKRVHRKRSPELAIAIAGRHPCSRFAFECLRFGADLLLEEGRLEEAERVLHRLAREYPHRSDTASWRERVRFAGARGSSEREGGGPDPTRIIPVAGPFDSPFQGRLSLGSRDLCPLARPGIFAHGDRIGIAWPPGFMLWTPGKGETGRWPPSEQWPVKETEGPSFPLGLLLGEKPIEGEPCDYRVALDRESVFLLTGIRALPGEGNRKRRGVPRELLAWKPGAEGKPSGILWRRSPEQVLGEGRRGAVFFLTPPLAREGLVWIGLALYGRTNSIFVSCLDGATGDVLWRTFLCGTARDSRSVLPVPVRTFPSLGELALDRGLLHVQTNVGLFAALDPVSGLPIRGVLYKRRDWGRFFELRTRFRLQFTGTIPAWPLLGPPLFMERWTVFAPWDSPLIMAVPARGGKPVIVWNGLEPGGAKNTPAVLGAFENLLIIGLRERLVALDADRAWSIRWMTPSRDPTGKRNYTGDPCGNAVAWGSRIVFPTTRGLFLLDPKTGRTVEGPGGSSGFGWRRAGQVRIARTGEWLTAAGASRVWVYRVE